MADSSVILVTGGNQGVGYATLQALLGPPHSKPYTIFLGSRSLERGEAAAKQLRQDAGSNSNCEVIPVQLDLDDDDSVEALLKELRSQTDRIDVLVNNAAAHYDFPLRDGKMTTREAFEKTFRTNVSSTFLFTEKMVDLLLESPSPRIVFISTGISSLGDHSCQDYSINQSPPAGWPKPYHFNVMTYRTSKTALNMMILELRRILKEDGVKVFIVDPGLLATTLGGADPEQLRKMGAGEPIDGGNFIRSVIDGARDADEGKLLSKEGVVPW